MNNYIKLPEDKYRKLLFQARGQYMAILNIFKCHGMDLFVDQAIEECMKVAENFGQAVRGDDKSILILDKPKARATE